MMKRSPYLNTSQFRDSSKDKTLQLFCIRNPFNNHSRNALECPRNQLSPKDHGQELDLNLVQEVLAAELVNHTIWEVHPELKRDKACSPVTHSLLNIRNPSNSCHLINNSLKYHLSKLLRGSQLKDFMVCLKTSRLQRDRRKNLCLLTNFW